MARISGSILGFYFDSKRKKESDNAMIHNINVALKQHDKDFDILHIDIEDGKFVSHKSFTQSQLKKIICPKKREIHLMVINYKKYLKDYFIFGDMFIFHHETLRNDFPKTIEFLKKNKKFVGIAVSPETRLDEIKHLDKIDLVLLMAIHPGLPGQKFIDTTLRKIRKLSEMRKKNNFKFKIEVDGGIRKHNMQKIIDAGADILELGTGLFGN